ncbi:MAG: hypothetical protein RL261_1965, partial [Pseudomonadota bacterium]
MRPFKTVCGIAMLAVLAGCASQPASTPVA